MLLNELVIVPIAVLLLGVVLQIQIVTVGYPACRECGMPTLPHSEVLISTALPHVAGELRERARLCENCRQRATALVMKKAMGGYVQNT